MPVPRVPGATTTTTIPTEPIGSVPRPPELIEALGRHAAGTLSDAELSAIQDRALRDTIARFEQTGSPIIADGEQTKPSFATYPIAGSPHLAPAGAVIPFADGHTRQLPLLTAGPFRYVTHASSYLKQAQAIATRPVKQAVIAASALSLLYPQSGIAGYSQADFLDDLVAEAQRDIRECLQAGAPVVQIDFTEGRLALKLDPSGGVLRAFVDLNNRVLSAFSADERSRIGVHTCPGGDQDSTHSADIDYLALIPELFRIDAGRFYVQLASEPDRPRVLRAMREALGPGRLLFVGVTDPIRPAVETPEQVRDRILEAAAIIPVESLGTTDDCGFSPFADDRSTPRDTAFAKIRSRIEGTALAAKALGLG